MQIENDPDYEIVEKPINLVEVEPNDVFRFAQTTYEGAIKRKLFYMCVKIDSDKYFINLHSGEPVCRTDITKMVFIHTAKVVVMPNN